MARETTIWNFTNLLLPSEKIDIKSVLLSVTYKTVQKDSDIRSA